MSPSVPTHLALLRWKARLQAAFRRRLGLEETVYVQSRVEEYRNYWATAAEKLSAEFVPLSDSVWEIRRGDREVRLSNYVTPLDDPVTLRMAGDRELCFRFAARAGVPTPDHVFFSLGTFEKAERHLLESEVPCVVKPAANTASGRGITVGITSRRELRDAAALASLYSRRLVIERMAAGESYRLLFLDGRLVHAVRRRGTRVVGDGRSTLLDLVGERGLDGDPLTELTLSRKEPALWVPESGEEVLVHPLPEGVSRKRELRTEYDEEATSLVGPAIVQGLGRLVEGMGVRLAGIDLVTSDASAPLEDTGGAFIELNTTPGIHHHYLTPEQRRDGHVAIPILRRLLEGANQEVPHLATRRRPSRGKSA